MRFIVTAGPTREFIDPVRFLSNPSTGRMGFAVARAARTAGHEVTLVAGPVALPTPRGVERVDVVSARDMLESVRAALKTVGTGADACLVMTAAVADWRPERCAGQKLKKREMDGVLRLVPNPDILKSVRHLARHCVRIGFAAETGAPVAEAVRKCCEKGLDMTVANDVTERGCGFGTLTNRVTVVFADGTVRPLPMMTKAALARRIVALAVEAHNGRR